MGLGGADGEDHKEEEVEERGGSATKVLMSHEGQDN